MKDSFPVPKEISRITETLEKAGFEAYLVGGCTRDLILGRKPKDWDITTNARPENIISLFSKTFYENDYGTVGVVNEDEGIDESLKVVEVTPYRLESDYSDLRRPDSVKFSDSIDDDLKRRDFTINALATKIKNGKTNTFIDLYGGLKDIKDKIVKTVGNADERFNEDALRLLRAIRLATELGFTINMETSQSIVKNADNIKKISSERIRDEFSRIIMSKNPSIGLFLMNKLGLLKNIIPELEESIGIEQGGIHKYDVWEHLIRSLQHSADKNMPLETRLSALFHDISKPETRRFSRETNEYSFYGHEVVGSRVTKKILERLKYPSKLIEKATKLVRWHMFFSDTETITLSAVRRMINNVGRENIWDLMDIRICDRIGTGRPTENPYRLRKYRSMIEEAMRDPISVQMLKIDGKKIMEITKCQPGPIVGYILNALLEEVLDNPSLNTIDYLEKRTLELKELDINELKIKAEAGKDKKDEEERKNIEEIRDKYRVNKD